MTLSNANATELLRRFSEHRQLVVSGQDRRWRWRSGTLLFPEGRCCYCGQAVRSNRIWVADPGWLRGQLLLKGDKAIWERPNHPHAGTDGGLCLGGTTDDLITVLFFGVNPADTIRWHRRPEAAAAGIREWYAEMFDHKCGEGEELKAADGLFVPTADIIRDRRADCACGCGCNPDGGECNCGCEACVCPRDPESFDCTHCEEEFLYIDRFEADGDYYCGDCYRELYQECWRCGRSIERNGGAAMTSPAGRIYCPSCADLEQRYRPERWYGGPITATATGATLANATPAEPPTAVQRARARLEAVRRIRWPRLPADIPPDDLAV